MAASVTPPIAPFQPACAAATTPRLTIGQQHRRAIGGEDAEQDAWPIRDDGIGMGAGIVGEWRTDGDGIRAVDLVQSRQRSAGQDGCNGTPPVFMDSFAVVTRAEADIEALQDTARNATLTAKEAVTHAIEDSGCDRNRKEIGIGGIHSPAVTSFSP